MAKAKPKETMVEVRIPARTARFSGGQTLEFLPTVLKYERGYLAQLTHAMKVVEVAKDGVAVYFPENAVDLLLWSSNGALEPGDPPGFAKVNGEGGDKLPVVGVGLTDSERALGFLVHKPDGNRLGFVLNRPQLEALRDFITAQLPRVNP
jgi:hypothetical protein